MLEKIRSLMEKANNECFGGQLNLNFPIKISNTSRALAQVSFSYSRFSGFVQLTSMSVSKNYEWTDVHLLNTIAHELIHVYEIQIAKSKPAHGTIFRREMNRINAIPGYKVDVVSEKEMACTKKRRALCVVSSNHSKLMLLSPKTVITQSLNEYISRTFGTDYKTQIVEVSAQSPYRIFKKPNRHYKTTPEKLTLLGVK